MNPSVGLGHDYLLVMRGAERTFEAIAALWPEAPVYTLLYDRGQARALARTYRFLAREKAQAIIVHRLRDSDVHDSEWLSSMGLLNADGSPKPAYEALRQVAASG